MTRLQFLLNKLAEEASEIAQIAMKAQQFGLYKVCPEKGETNLARITAEYNDLEGIVAMLNEEFHAEIFRNSYAVLAKAEKVNRYYQYSVDLDQVKPL